MGSHSTALRTGNLRKAMLHHGRRHVSVIGVCGVVFACRVAGMLASSMVCLVGFHAHYRFTSVIKTSSKSAKSRLTRGCNADQESDGSDHLHVGLAVTNLGIKLSSRPPGPVIIKSVLPYTWAQAHNIQAGDEIVSVASRNASQMTGDDFVVAMKMRPTTVRITIGGCSGGLPKLRQQSGGGGRLYAEMLANLKAASRLGDLQEAKKWFTLFAQAGGTCDERTFGQMISCAAKRGNLLEAEKWFNEIIANGIVPQVPHYSAVMDAAAKQGQLDVAEAWFKRMRAANISADRIIYKTLMSAAAKGKSFVAAERWFCAMMAENIEPDTISYNVLMKAARGVANISLVENIYDRMVAADLKPDVFTFGTLLSAASLAEDLPRLEYWLSEARRMGIPFSYPMYGTLVDLYFRLGQPEAVANLLVEMRAAGKPPRVVDYNDLINAWAKAGHLAKVQETLREMLASGVRPDHVTLKIVRKSLGQTRFERLAREMRLFEIVDRVTDHFEDRLLQSSAEKWANNEAQRELSR